MSWQGRRALTDQQERTRFEAEFARTDASTDPFVSAVRATRMPMLITDPHGPDNPIIFANAAFTKLTGYTRDEILGQNCRFLQGPETDRADVAKIRDAVLNLATKDKAAFDKIYEGKQGPLVAVDNKAYDPIIELNKFVDALRKKKSS